MKVGRTGAVWMYRCCSDGVVIELIHVGWTKGAWHDY